MLQPDFLALLFIVIGAVFDFFDGMTARLLHVSSPIGKELDSLADDITFGFAPSAIIFSWTSEQMAVASSSTFHSALPYVAFVMAAFSALRLAKFNLDERQAMGFIGLPTPANALFWGSLIVGAGDFLASSPYSVYGVIAAVFALKFKTWGWKGNEVKYIFLLTSIILLAFLGVSGLAAVIAWYILLSILTQRK